MWLTMNILEECLSAVKCSLIYSTKKVTVQPVNLIQGKPFNQLESLIIFRGGQYHAKNIFNIYTFVYFNI